VPHDDVESKVRYWTIMFQVIALQASGVSPGSKAQSKGIIINKHYRISEYVRWLSSGSSHGYKVFPGCEPAPPYIRGDLVEIESNV
jgi:hypothetical protein